jgi:hypothetical protein
MWFEYGKSFQETAGDFFDVIVARLETGKDPTRRKGADYILGPRPFR